MRIWNRPFMAGLCLSLSVGAASTNVYSAAKAQINATGGADLTAQLKSMPMPSMPLKQRAQSGNGKLDNTLLHISQKLAGSSNPAAVDLSGIAPHARIATLSPLGKPAIVVDVIAKGSPAATRADLEKIGFHTTAVYKNDIGGWLPLDQIKTAAALGSVHHLHASMMHLRTGAIDDQGDYVQKSLALRSSTLYTGTGGNGLTGKGINIGLISDSFNCQGGYAQDVTTGDLPADYLIVKEDPTDPNSGDCVSGTDEGRAMSQIAYDVAPGSKLAFYTADESEADFANGIITLATPVAQGGVFGAQVVVDDVGYFDEPIYQDGIVGDAINTVAQQFGTLYFSAAGNEGRDSYENTTPQFETTAADTPDGPEQLLNMDPSGATHTDYLPITVPPLAPGDGYYVLLEWDQPYATGATVANPTGSLNALDVCLGDDQGNIIYCGGISPAGTDPWDLVPIFNGGSTTSAPANLSLIVGYVPGTLPDSTQSTPLPGRIKLVVLDDGRGTQITQFITASSTIQGHPLAESAMAVAAVPYYRTTLCGNYATASLELFSSAGGDPFLFDLHSAAPLAQPFVPQKPEIAAPDRGENTFFGGPLDGIYETAPECQPSSAYPFSFAGTSAAAPHAAGVAALMLEAAAASGVTVKNTDVYAAMKKSAQDMNSPGFDYDSGFGLLQADAAVAALLPATLSLSAPSFTFSSATTQTETITNSGTGPLTIASPQVSPSGITLVNNCPATVAAGASCTMTLTLASTGASASQGTLSFSTNAQNFTGSASVAISVPTQIALSPTSVTFSVHEHQTATQAVTISNSGLSPLSIGAVQVSPSAVSQTNTCTAAVAPAATCVVTLTLDTTHLLSRTLGQLTVASNAAAGTASVPVSASVSSNDSGGGAFGPWLLLPGLALAGLRRRRRD